MIEVLIVPDDVDTGVFFRVKQCSVISTGYVVKSYYADRECGTVLEASKDSETFRTLESAINAARVAADAISVNAKIMNEESAKNPRRPVIQFSVKREGGKQ